MKVKVETAKVVSPKVISQPFPLFFLPELCASASENTEYRTD